MYDSLIIGSNGTGTGSITLLKKLNASPTLTIGDNSTANTISIFDADNTLTSLATGSDGQVLRVVNDVPTWSSGGSVDEVLTLKFDGGATEGTDLFTFDGSAAKTIDFIGGNLISLDDSVAGEITFDHVALGSSYTTGVDDQTTLANIELLNSLTVDGYGHVSGAEYRKLVAGSDVTITAAEDGNITIAHEAFSTTTPTGTPEAPGFAGTFDVIDSITTDNGHVTSVQTTTITIPTETTLSVEDTGTGTWVTDIEVDDHEITLSRSNTTEATIQVGELTISNTGAGSGDLNIDGNAVIGGNLTVSGTVTTVNTETIALADNIIELNSNIGANAPSQDAGIEINRGNETNYQFIFDETADEFKIGEVGGLQPVLTRDELVNLVDGDILVFDHTNDRAVGKTLDELALPSKYAVTIGDDSATSFNIDHNLNTEDVTVAVKELATGEIVFTQIVVDSSNRVVVSFAVAPTTDQYRVVVIG